ncbi:alpha-N-acetylgalactosaminide alpha-2,6-sialyltransferase 2 [Brachyhypopomus gauderio]|uniref:alpha-N-acetylgalactosaminide alpha-2,6-sialyltransferase 2 n=1 Tax=Brachyhypopomus gauderio TaxID=698409 RepID=UPI004043323D
MTPGFLPLWRLVLFFLALSAFLGLYVLHLNPEITPWHVRDQPPVHDTSRLHDSQNDKNSSVEYQQATQTTGLSNRWKDKEPNSTEAAGSVNSPTPVPGLKTNPTTAARQTMKAVRPTEVDFIGDQYATDDFPSQTICPSGIRRMVYQTPFAGRFLDSVPVLQWAKHFSLPEFQRLSRYPGAHGWGGIDIDVLNKSLAVLNGRANRVMFEDWETRQNRSKCIRCAVVGNGGILRGSKKGREIDQHDYVFRTNGAVVEGFEEDVGRRTSHYTFSTNTLRNSMRNYAGAGYLGPPLSKETKYVFLPDHDRDYILMTAAATHTPIHRGPERCTKPPHYFGDVTSEKFKMYHPDFIRYIRNRFLRSRTLSTRNKDIYRPSTGAVMLLAAFHTCDQVSAYGFMTPDYNKYSDHYYDKTYNPVRFYANHDLRMEMNLWQQLHQAGLIRLYMRP